MTNPLSNLRSEIAQINLISVLQQRSAASASTAAAHANWMRAEPRDFPSTASGQDAMMVGAVSTRHGCEGTACAACLCPSS